MFDAKDNDDLLVKRGRPAEAREGSGASEDDGEREVAKQKRGRGSGRAQKDAVDVNVEERAGKKVGVLKLKCGNQVHTKKIELRTSPPRSMYSSSGEDLSDGGDEDEEMEEVEEE